MGSFSIWHWLVVLIIVLLVFGTKKLRNIGGDVGGAVKSFKDAMNAEKNGADEAATQAMPEKKTALIEADVVEVMAEKPAPKKRVVAKKPAAAKPKAAAAKKPAAKKTSAS